MNAFLWAAVTFAGLGPVFAAAYYWFAHWNLGPSIRPEDLQTTVEAIGLFGLCEGVAAVLGLVGLLAHIL
jgi:hypothetical protein